jgi:hypothetical protein
MVWAVCVCACVQLVSTATAPTNFVHHIHVGFDAHSGSFVVRVCI